MIWREEEIKAKPVELSSNRINSRKVNYLQPISFDTDFSNDNHYEYPIGYGRKFNASEPGNDNGLDDGRAYSKKRPGYRN